MQFIDSNLENVLTYMDKLSASSTPSWGSMSAQQMIEHLTTTIELAMGKYNFPLLVKEEDFPKMRAFILSDKPMPRNFKVDFAPENPALVNEELELAIDTYCDTWLEFELWSAENEGIETIHPNFGPLNFDLWKKLHEKHITHHFTQFNLI